MGTDQKMSALLLEPTHSSGRAFFTRGLRRLPLYLEHTLPFLQVSGGELLDAGAGGDFLIGPE